MHIHLSRVRFSVFRMLIVYGGTTTVIAVADLMRGNMGSLIIGKEIGMEAVGVFGVALSIISCIAGIVGAGMGVLTPRFAALDGRGEHAEARGLLMKALALSSFLSFGACTAVMVLSKGFILWWVGNDFGGSVPVLRILTLSGAFALAQNPVIVYLYALNKHNYYAAATIVEGIMAVTLGVILASHYSVVGVALGTMIPMFLVKTFVMPVYVSRLAGISLRDYVTPILPPCLVAVAITMTASCVEFILPTMGSQRYLIVCGLVVGVLYCSACWRVIPSQYRIDFNAASWMSQVTTGFYSLRSSLTPNRCG